MNHRIGCSGLGFRDLGLGIRIRTWAEDFEALFLLGLERRAAKYACREMCWW